MGRIVLLFCVSLGLTGAVNASSETCYQLSSDGEVWSPAGEKLCVSPLDATRNQFVLKTSMNGTEEVVATFQMPLLQQTITPNAAGRDRYGVVLNKRHMLQQLDIILVGTRNPQTGVEMGTVKIARTNFHYRTMQ